VSDSTSGSPLAEEILGVLEPLLGPHTSGHALKVVCKRLGCPPHDLRWTDADRVTTELTPMLRTLLGRAAAERVREKILGAGGST
jgi:hypothetical protein